MIGPKLHKMLLKPKKEVLNHWGGDELEGGGWALPKAGHV